MKSFCQIYAQFDQTGPRIGEEAQHLLDLGLVCDIAFDLEQGSRNPSALRAIADAGGLCAPTIYPATLDRCCRDSNWWKYSKEECSRLLGLASQRFAALEIGPMQAVNTYTPGNGFVAACREREIDYILGFCAPTVGEDGGWEIAHYGSPLSPYFISAEDFRKPTRANSCDGRAVMMANMELRNPMVCLNHWNEGPWDPLNAQAADRWLEPSADPLPFLQIAEDWLRQSELSGRTLFFNINLQYFFAGRCYEHNRRALEWLALQRDRGRLEVGGLKAWRKRLIAGGDVDRQTSYWRGEMMGFHVGHRPGCFPDVVVDESSMHQGVWQKPNSLPRRLYDYHRKWNYPAFVPDGSAPASEEFGVIEVVITGMLEGECSRRFTIRARNIGQSRNIPLMIWDAFDGWVAPFTIDKISEGWTARVVPHPSGIGGAVLVEGEVREGETVIEVVVASSSLAQQVFVRSWDGLVEAQTFFREGRPYTILAAQTPEPFVLAAQIIGCREGREPVIAESLIGIEHERKVLKGSEIALRFDGSRLVCWHRLWGLRADEIELTGVEEAKSVLKKKTQAMLANYAPDVAADGVGYQLFGNIRDSARWDRCLARAVGEAEMKKMNEWFCAQRPGFGETVIEVHPGILLPRGSITKVLGHEFDVVKCAQGYCFRELCVDYPQGWDWGVAAWVQWRHLRICLEGLRPNGDTYVLHLHACDPEGRDIVQSVHFFNPDATAVAPLIEHVPLHRKSDICAVRDWILPRGVEGRWQPEALCSVLIPEVCLGWSSIGVWIVPLERTKLYDWVSEQSAPGLISHLWVTRLERRSA